jgi:hypothetical protein
MKYVFDIAGVSFSLVLLGVIGVVLLFFPQRFRSLGMRHAPRSALPFIRSENFLMGSKVMGVVCLLVVVGLLIVLIFGDESILRRHE